MRIRKPMEENEELLKQVALTINAKGISKNLKFLITKKITHNKNNLRYLSEMTKLTENQDSSKIFQKKDHLLTQFMDHLLKEIKITDMALDLMLQNLSQRELMVTTEMTNNKGIQS